jgi:hypothetical protein
MSKKEVAAKNSEAPVAGGPTSCVAEGCKQKSSRLNFCSEHYDWFKAGLVTKNGIRPRDFDKKWINYTKKKAAA